MLNTKLFLRNLRGYASSNPDKLGYISKGHMSNCRAKTKTRVETWVE